MQHISVFVGIWLEWDLVWQNLFVSHSVPVYVFKKTFFYHFFECYTKVGLYVENVLEEVSSSLIYVSRELDVALYGLLLYHHGVFYIVERKAAKEIKG